MDVQKSHLVELFFPSWGIVFSQLENCSLTVYADYLELYL